MFKYFIFFVLVFPLAIDNDINAQEYHRISSDFSVKIAGNNGMDHLTKGKVYYDKNYDYLIFDITFPRRESWVFKDTVLSKLRNDTIYSKTTIPEINEYTIFNLVLNGQLNNFGLAESLYRIEKVDKQGDMIISYWSAPSTKSLNIGKIILARKDGLLRSVFMVDNKSKIVSKHYFQNYEVKGVIFIPTKIVQIVNDNIGNQNFQVTEFTNIKFNDWSAENKYQFSIK